ncbi:MAG TPA: hypothetical protein VKI17_13570, partial [Gemmataceae bacterium]|nr:hypothetical protein [Gemmataceae bacterium]
MMKPIHACLVGLLVSLGCGGDTPQSKPVAATYPRQIAQEAQQQQPADEQVAGGNAIENNLV